MKTLALFFAFALSFTISHAQDSLKTYTITIKIANALSDKGHALIGLHTEDTFMKGKGIQASKSEIKDGKVTVSFNNIEAGNYAIMVLHDENDNNKMDFEATGMPKESYAMSNNPMLFGPPTFTDAKFILDEKDLELSIRF